MTPDQQRAHSALDLGPRWQLRAAAEQPSNREEVNLKATALVESTPGESALGKSTFGESALSESALSWSELALRVSQCQRCSLSVSRRQTVFGVGPTTARLMIIGEAPGQEEDASGEPFVGPAGKLLDNMLAAIGLNRAEHVFIANVLKCRPPGNRNPEALEVAACSPYLQRQIALLQPRLILAMGRFAAQTLLQTDASIASLRERQHRFELAGITVPVIVTYHPAYLLRNLADKSKAWTDLLLTRRLLD